MQMPMQVSLDDLLSMLMARVEGMAIAEENLKTRFNVFARALYRKGLLTDNDVLEAIREEYTLLKDLGLLGEMPKDDVLQSVADSILQWVRCDVDALKKGMEDYEKRMREASTQEARKSKIDVASPVVLSQLDRMSGQKNRQGGGKLII